jgi:hypothetical protein
MEHHSESDDRSDYEDDSSVMFNILEETMDAARDSGSESGYLDGSDDNNSSLGLDDLDDQAIRESSNISSDHNIPDVVIQLQKQLLGGYTLPPRPAQAPLQPTLSEEEILSLHHYLAWTESHGTVKAYTAYAKVLAVATQKEILSLHRVRKLALKLTGLKPSFVDMCPKSCMAFTGDSQSDSTCSYKDCNEPHYKSQQSSQAKLKPRATMLYMPITPIIQAYYANAETSHQMQHRDHCLKQTLDVLARGAGVSGVKKSEFSNSENHIDHFKKLGLFMDGRDTALSMSLDGAQLTMKKQSNMWLLIVVLLNLPLEMCYKANNVIIPLAIPGPSAPGNVESFIYPLFEELAKASIGMWTWDAVDSSYFVLRAYLCGVKGYMLGSAKLSGMAGHSAKFGDHFSLVQGGKGAGAKAQYYPISPPEKEIFNPRRDIVDLAKLLLRGQRHYWDAIKRLELAATEAECKKIVLETGVSRLTMCAASPAFSHPSFFPLDPFHLFYENCMVHIWDLWVTHSEPDEQIHMDKKMASSLGEEIEKAVKTLPSSFSSPIRNPYKKHNSQYKIYEWMALLHWYIIPIAWELGFNDKVLRNFVQFVDIIETAMSHTQKSDDELASLYNLVRSFLDLKDFMLGMTQHWFQDVDCASGN